MASGQEFPLVTMSHESLAESRHEDNSEFHEEEAPQYEEATPMREEALPPYQRQDTANTTPLRRNYYILVPTAMYTVLVLYSWITICLISHGPLVLDNEPLKYRQYYAARITQSIVSVATLPMLSAVCACAAAVFVQNQRNADSLSVRQVMALADRRWSDPLSYRYFLSLTRTPGALKRFGCSFLYLAMFMHLIGAITYPIQSIFLHVDEKYFDPVDSTLSQGSGGEQDYILTLSQILSSSLYSGASPRKAEAIGTLRRQLELVDAGGYQAQLWGTAGKLTDYNASTDWYAQVPANYNTGSYSQITTRINSSAESGEVPFSEFPANCSSVQDYFYTSLNYTNQYLGDVNIQACYPYNVTLSPWLATDARQDFTEVLYLNITTGYFPQSDIKIVGTYKITMDTTAAFFELPNAYNGGKPGDLLANPKVSCEFDDGCIDLNTTASPLDKRQLDTDSLIDQLYNNYNLLGPLATISIALFGPGSWFDNQQTLFNTDYDNDFSNETGWRDYLDNELQYELLPLLSLASEDEQALYDYGVAASPIYSWLEGFIEVGSNTTLAAAFARASYFANKALIETTDSTAITSYGIRSSTLKSTLMPSISLAGMIVVSVLIGLYMVPFLALALYAGLINTWTRTLDSFVMLRMGAAIGQKDLPMQIGKRMGKIEVLDQLPGVIRDVSGPDDKVRQLALGVGGSRLQSKVRYLAYPGNKPTIW
jgi:hypothetical protein